MIKCPDCGFENRTTANFCAVCGKNLKQSYSEDKPTISPECYVLQKGTVLNERFEIENLINIGGMGYVYKGEDQVLKRSVAIKEMIDRFTDPNERTEAIERFKRESEILCKLDHPAIPEFFDYFVENQRYYIVMALVDGVDLGNVIQRLEEEVRTVPIKNAILWAIQICDVLMYLHSFKPQIIYRDLKPSNIVVTPNGKIKLIDFGIARLFISKIKGTMIGTQGYAPPEQYRGKAEPRSDIYSLGATLHHLLTGKDPRYEAPFHFPSARSLNPDIPASLEEIIDNTLKMVPEDRYRTARQLKKALTEMMEKEELSTGIDQEIRTIEEEITLLNVRKQQFLEERDRLLRGVVNKKSKTEDSKPVYTRTWRFFCHDPQRTGRTKIPTYIHGRLNWRFDLKGAITASPVIDFNGNIYMGTFEGKFFSISHSKIERWTFQADGPIPRAAAVDLGGSVYLLSEEGTLYCLNPIGKEAWRYHFGNMVSSSLLLESDLIFWGDMEGIFHCVNFKGKNLWSHDLGSSISSSIAFSPDATLIVGNHDGKVCAITIDGIEWEARAQKSIFSTPAVSPKGIVYIGCEDGCLYSIAPGGEILWKFKTNDRIHSSPALGNDGTIYLGSGDGNLYSIDQDGFEKWRFDAGSEILSSPAISDEGTIYFSSSDGFLFAVRPWGKSRWWFDLESRVTSSPAIGPSGNLYIGTESGYIYSIK